MTRRPELRVPRDDDGATLIIAVTVMLIIATLSLAVLGRTLASMRFVRHSQDYDAALAAADAGLSDALFRIDQTATGRAAAPTFSGAGSAGVGSFAYRALRHSASEYELLSVGRVGESNHAVRARITRSVKFPFALYAAQDLVFNGNSSMNIYSFDDDGNRTGEARVGSSHQIVVASGKGAGDEQHYYAPYGGCSGCPHPVGHPLEEYSVMGVTEPVGATLACPTDGIFSGTVDGAGGVPVVCRQDVVFSGTVHVTNGPLVVYVLPTSGDPNDHHALDISGAVVNPDGHSVDMQVYKAGDAPLLVGNGNTSGTMTFNGIMYAPESTVTVNGGKFWKGAWVVNALNVNGGPNIEIGYDLDTSTYYGIDWKISRYEEVGSTTAMTDGVAVS